MSTRADAIIKDILVNHLPRIKEGLEAGYVDENQVLVIYDHLVRARILKEETGNITSIAKEKSTGVVKLQKLPTFNELYMDRIDPSDGTIVMNEDNYKQLLKILFPK